MINEAFIKSTDTCMYALMSMVRTYAMFGHDTIKKNPQININRVGMLMALRVEGDKMSQAMLADMLCVKPSSVTSMLNNMEKEGLIVRESDAEDKRTKRISLTKQGEAIADEAFEYMMCVSKNFFINFTEEEKEEFIFLMHKMEDNMKNILSSDWITEFGMNIVANSSK